MKSVQLCQYEKAEISTWVPQQVNESQIMQAQRFSPKRGDKLTERDQKRGAGQGCDTDQSMLDHRTLGAFKVCRSPVWAVSEILE